MAEQAYVIDIDTQFLDNIKKADEHLKSLLETAYAFTDQFKDAVFYTGGFAERMQNLEERIAKLGGLKVDDIGLVKINTEAMEIIDKTNLWAKAVDKLQARYDSLVSGDRKPLLGREDIKNISELDLAIKILRDELKNNGHLGGELQRTLVDELRLYEDAQKEMMKSTDKRVGEETKSVQQVFNETEKQFDKIDKLATKNERERVSGIQDEYERILKRIEEIEATEHRLSVFEEKKQDGRTPETRSLMNEMEDEASKLNARKEQIERDHQDEISNIVEREQSKRFSRRVRQMERENEEELEIKKRQQRSWDKFMSSGMRSIEYSQRDAQSIVERKKAIKYLEYERDHLKESTMTTEEYESAIKQLNDEIKRQNGEIARLTDRQREMKGEQEQLVELSSRLSKALAGVFGIHAIRGYINKLISVRGEMELQNRSIQAIIGNKREANRVWEQTIKLATKSPFQIKEMVTYTKQLLAYRVESEKVVEINKMLADISAGLGVDMSRLILAYGQVKAANYLRGTELRQFSEAGINILDELATHFSTLENTTVSVGEVFERVTKRMVSFEDVETVLKKVTSAGGTFYRMQEIQSETLKGQISNLKDSITVMLNEIGESNDGIMKNGVALAKSVVDNWQSVASTLKAVLLLLTIIKVQAVLSSTKMLNLAREMQVVSSTFSGTLSLGQGLKAILLQVATSAKTAVASIAKFITANPVIAALVLSLMALTKAAKVFFDYRNDVKEINQEYKELRNTIHGIAIEFNKAFDENILSSARARLLDLINVANKEYGLNIVIRDIDKMDELTLHNTFVSIRDQVFDAQNLAAELEKQFVKPFQGLMTYFATSSVEGPLDYLQSITDKAEGLFNKLRDEAKSVAFEIHSRKMSLNDAQKKAVEDLLAPMGTEETKLQYIKRIKDAYIVLGDVAKDAGAKFAEVLIFSTDIGLAGKKVERVFKKLEDDIRPWWSDEQKERYIKLAINQVALKEGLDETAQEILYWVANNHFEIDITPSFKSDDVTKVWAKWQESYNKKVEQSDVYKSLSSVETTREQLIKEIEETKSVYEADLAAIRSIGVEMATGVGGAYEGVDVAKLEDAVKEGAELLKWLRGTVTETNDSISKSQRDWAKDVAKVVRDAHKDYVQLAKDLDHLDSRSLSLSRNIEVFREAASHIPELKDIDLGELKFETEKGAIDALTMLKNKLPESATEARYEIEKAIGDIRGEVRIERAKDNTQKLANEIEEMFAGYELSLELRKLNVPKNWAKSLFDIDAIDLSDIRERVVSDIEDVESRGGEKDKLQKLQEFLKRVDELERKAQEERMKKYLEYARDAIGERAKIKLEELKKLQEIELAFGDDPNKAKAKEAAIKNVRKESEQATMKNKWEEFQKSDLFVNLFDDLDNASSKLINHAISKLEEFKEQWRDMPHEEMKSIVQKINQLRTKLGEFGDPWQNAKDLKELRSKDSRSTDDIYASYISNSERKAKADEEIAHIRAMLSYHREDNAEQLAAYAVQNNRVDLYEKTAEELKAELSLQENNRDLAIEQMGVDKTTLDIHARIATQYSRQADALSKAQSMANDLYDSFKSLSEVLGGSDSVANSIADAGMEMMNITMSALSGYYNIKKQEQALIQAGEAADSFGMKMNAAMGIVGWIVMGVQLLTSASKAVFAIHDKSLEDNIQNINAHVVTLQKELNVLEEALNEAYSTTQLSAYTRELEKNVEAQINAYDAMIALEEDKKKTDEGKIEQWKEEQDKLRKTVAEAFEDAFSKATNSVLDDALSAADAFVDAWYEAFQATGDGLSGLEDNFREMLINLIKRQASMQLVGPFVKKYSEALKKYVDIDGGDSELSVEDARRWAEEVTSTFPELSNMLENFFSGTQDLLQEQGELSELSKGIQGVTESTAQVLEALLNSMRFYVADSNVQLKNIANALISNDVEANPLLNELRQQTAMIRSIEGMFDSVIGRGDSIHSGAYLKVSM